MSLFEDVRYGLRQLRRSPAFTLVAVLALGIGVGTNITIFLFANQWLLRPLDARDPDRLIRVTGPGGNAGAAGASDNEAHILPADYRAYKAQNQSFSMLAASHAGGPTRVRIDGPPQMIPVTPVTGNFFDMLGVPAALGRTLRPEDAEAGAPPVIVLSDAGWRRFFHARPDVVGTTAYLNGEPRTVVGVLPSWFSGTYVPMVPQIYSPLIEDGPGAFPIRMQVIGRLKPGVTPEQARADLTRIAAGLTAADLRLRSIEIYPARSVVPFMLRGVTALAMFFALIVVVVLLIACDNVAIFMAIRSAARSREIGIRVALGATRARLIRQLLIESAIVSALGGGIGMYCAYLVARFAGQFYLPVPMPFALTFTLDWRVVVFAVAASCGATVLCGLAPARRALKADVLAALRQATIGGRVESSLVIAQVTLSTALLVTAVVLGHSLIANVTGSRGINSAGVVMATVPLSGPAYPAARRHAVLTTLLQRIEQAPGVSSATIVDNIPRANNSLLTLIPLRSGTRIAQAFDTPVSHGFFRTLGIPLLAGRDFASSDDVNPLAVAIVNETLARQLWPNENPVGKHIDNRDGTAIEIVGLSRNIESGSATDAPRSYLYRPTAATQVTTPTLLIRTSGDSASLISFVRTQIGEIDPDLVAYNLMPLDDRLNLGLIVNRTAATISGSLGLLALALGSFGLYGTMSFLVQLRRREIGVRLALGASRRVVMTTVAASGMRWAAWGLLVGLALASLASLGLSRFLSGVTAFDPLAFILAPLALAAAAYAACHLPARRAARLDPLVVLREE